MPVSRKRKQAKQKKTQQRRQSQGLPRSAAALGVDSTDFLADLTRHREQLDLRRGTRAKSAAGPLLAELTELAATATESELEDELCVRMGRTLTDLAAADGLETHVGPNIFLEVFVDTALGAIDDAGPAWQAPWRVAAVVAGTVPEPFAAMMADALGDLRARINAAVLPLLPSGPVLAGRPVWTRDLYGSRFGVAAPFRIGDGPERWYLWDIDTCSGTAHTVHGRYHETLDAALADWLSGVGEPAADGVTFGPIDDRELLDRLMPREEGFMRIGGETTEQFAEYHRSKRLAEVVLAETPVRPTDRRDSALSKEAAGRFADWYLAQADLPPQPTAFDELVGELADSWLILDRDAPYQACSPHRITQVAAHVRGFYQDDFAAELTALLPAWVSWLIEQGDLPVHLAERSRAVALNPPVVADGSAHLTRVTE
ncbi:hypothetical protein [Cryptosporangium sp. NPDC051539]|uniref:hypothetical protein n=1 Tax=Cryptosporangium sp. NPDC051539 TaxID=3363962 RepID=UPI0037970982